VLGAGGIGWFRGPCPVATPVPVVALPPISAGCEAASDAPAQHTLSPITLANASVAANIFPFAAMGLVPAQTAVAPARVGQWVRFARNQDAADAFLCCRRKSALSAQHLYPAPPQWSEFNPRPAGQDSFHRRRANWCTGSRRRGDHSR
jgi:hypothetical protein